MKKTLVRVLKLPILLVTFWVSLQAFAGLPTTVLFTDHSFNIQPFGHIDTSHVGIDEIEQVMRRLQLEMGLPLSWELFQMSMVEALGANSVEAQQYRLKFPPKEVVERGKKALGKYFYRALSQVEYTMVNNGEQVEYRIKDGLKFWDILLNSSDDLFEHNLIMTFFATQALGKDDPAKQFAYFSNVAAREKTTMMISLRGVGFEDRKLIHQMIAERGYLTYRHDDHLLVGRGHSFYLARDVMMMARHPYHQQEHLAKSFERILRFMSAQSTPIKTGVHQGAIAYYNILQNYMAFVSPGRSDLNAYTHEMTHARFDKFLNRLKSWAKHHNYVIPYDVDGPPQQGSTFGGYMNLLNEVNSWRVGLAFYGQADDKHILNQLSGFYGKQAGEQAAAEFGKVWTVDRLKGKSVPRLIVERIRQLNNMSMVDIEKLGAEAMVGNNAIKAINFARLVANRFGNSNQVLPDGLAQILFHLHDSMLNSQVKTEIVEALQILKVNYTMAPFASRLMSSYGLARTAQTWVIELSMKHNLIAIPSDFLFGGENTLILLFAQLRVKPKTVEELQHIVYQSFGKTFVSEQVWKKGALLKDIVERTARGEVVDFEQVVVGHIKAFNELPLSDLLDAFARRPNDNLVRLILTKHAGDFDEGHLKKLLELALRRESSFELRFSSLKIIETIFQMKGIPNMAASAELRPPHSHPQFFTEELDRFLAKLLFSERFNPNRVEVVNFLRQYTYPEEFPHTFERMMEIINMDGDMRDPKFVAQLSTAEEFLSTIVQDGPRTHISWGMTFLERIEGDRSMRPDVLENAAIYYRSTLGPHLFVNDNGVVPIANDGKTLRKLGQESLGMLDPQKRGQFEMATRHLWQMIGQQDINVKMAAIFAVASFPEYVIGLEQRIYHAIKNKNSRHHRWAFKLYTMLDKGLLPDVDALMEDPKFVGSLRDIQRELYKKRVDIFDGMTDEAQVRSSCAGYAVRFLP